MTDRLRMRKLVIAEEAVDATARCMGTGCAFTQRWLGRGAESAACEAAKRHAERTGHRVLMDYTRHAEYASAKSAEDRRVPRDLPAIQVPA